MALEPPNWKLIDEATRTLTGRGLTPFTRIQVYEEIWRRHPERQRVSLDPTFQGMIRNAAGGPTSAGGTPLRRVDRGLYVRAAAPELEAAEHQVWTSRAQPADEVAAPAADLRREELRVADSVPLGDVLAHLAEERPVFHSEADFQHAFAWQLHLLDSTPRVRLETRPAPGMRLDLLVSNGAGTKHTAIEFKYLTKRWQGEVQGERFELKDQGAQDITGYDVVKDITRVEQLVHERTGWSGAVLCLSNDSYYWRAPSHSRPTNADAFRLTEGTVLRGVRKWGPLTGAGTRAGRERDLELRHAYALSWSGYSTLPGHSGEFRVLVVTVPDIVR